MARRLRSQEGASAVELALLAPLLFLILFGIIEWGIAFLQVQSIRAGVREGGRAAAVGAPVNVVRQKTVAGSSGSIPLGQTGNIQVNKVCTPQDIGSDVTVTYDTSQLPDGGVVVQVPLIPRIVMSPVISSSFRCEV